MNGFEQPWNTPSWGGTNWNQPYNTPRINTNKVYVTSLEDALTRSATRGSEMVYFHQDANEFYVVKTDVDGRKSWMGFTYTIPNQDANLPATKADLKDILDRLEKLEKGEVTDVGKSNG